MYCLRKQRYEEIIDACNDEIENHSKVSSEAEVNVGDERQPKTNGTQDSEDEGFSADDSQKEILPNGGSGDSLQTDIR